MCVHPTTTRAKLDSFCQHHDAKVQEWIHQLSIDQEISSLDKHPGFQIIGDNVDVYVKSRHERMNSKAKSMHWFQIYAIKNRISGSHLPNDLPLNDILTVPNSIFIPTVSDCLKLRSHLIILCSRILIKYCPFFVEFSSCVEKHIIHNYSAEMSKPSEIVRTIFHSFNHNQSFFPLRFHLESLGNKRLKEMK